MYGQDCISLLTYLVVAAPVSLAFNIDSANPSRLIFDDDERSYFGYKVLQFISGKSKGFMVTAPLGQNGSGTGKVCRFNQDQTRECFVPQGNMTIKHFGLSLAMESSQSKFTMCSPSIAHECYENSYLNGVCYQLNEELQEMLSFKPSYQECTKKTVDLVFLFDGSGSMTEKDFNKNKKFILEVMNNNKNTSIKYAAVQFSTDVRKVFDFKDYQNGRHYALLEKEKHMDDLTNTYRALIYVFENLLMNQAAGATPDAAKVLVIITDGDPSDSTSYSNFVNTYAKHEITRLVIGVKDVKMKELEAIASDPKLVFPINNYNGLEEILKNLEKKIFTIEGGSQTALAERMIHEMSQSGFSGIYHEDTLVLGTVGSYNWSGCLYEFKHPQSEGTEIQDPAIVDNSYMGYSVAAGNKNQISLYFTGAPRFNHTGQVIVFKKEVHKWVVADRVHGNQMGSYFGAELCPVDYNSDGNIDFLLVGAPMFHHSKEKREGQIYIYKLTKKLKLRSMLNISGPSQGRFGTTISSLADLNGDGCRDVAVGAPHENGNRGAVYIYLGSKRTGIHKDFSQRIPAELINTRLQFFGIAVDGNIDLGEDGLADIVVGSRGAVVVLRSKPVVHVSAQLHFDPAKISTVSIDCLGNNDAVLPMVTLTVCFDLTQKTGTASMGLNVSYSLDIDPILPTSRGTFGEKGSGARNLQSTVELMAKRHNCFNHSTNMPKCVHDTLSPIIIKLKFSQPEHEKALSILNAGSKTQAIEVPFEKNCKNDSCVAELEVDFNFTTRTLLVVDQNFFNVILRLSNKGDDSYNTKISLFYPPGLSFSMMTLLTWTRPTLHSCKDQEGAMDKTICGVSLPVYRSGTAIFKASFRVDNTYDWNDTMSMTINGTSDNNDRTMCSANKSIPVQFQVDLRVTVNEDTVSYLNFTLEDSAPKNIVNIYEVRNLGFKALPVNVYFIIPTKMEHNFEMRNTQVLVIQNKTQCVETNKSSGCPSEMNCKVIECESFLLDKYSMTQFNLSGELAFGDLKQRARDMTLSTRFTGEKTDVLFKNFVEVTYDKDRYVQASTKQPLQNENGTSFPRAQISVRVELIILPDVLLIAAMGGGAGLLLLFIITLIMFKMGCFKSKSQKNRQDESQEENPAGLTDGLVEANASSQEEENEEAKQMISGTLAL